MALALHSFVSDCISLCSSNKDSFFIFTVLVLVLLAELVLCARFLSKLVSEHSDLESCDLEDLVSMAMAKFEIEKFDGTGDFKLWKRKIRAIITQQKAAKAIDDPKTIPDTLKPEELQAMIDTANSILILNLSDNILRMIDEDDTPLKIWTKLETLYSKKDLSNKIYIKERLFTYEMDSGKSMAENLDEYKKLTLEYNGIGEDLGEENEAIILLNSLPESYKDVKAIILLIS